MINFSQVFEKADGIKQPGTLQQQQNSTRQENIKGVRLTNQAGAGKYKKNSKSTLASIFGIKFAFYILIKNGKK